MNNWLRKKITCSCQEINSTKSLKLMVEINEALGANRLTQEPFGLEV